MAKKGIGKRRFHLILLFIFSTLIVYFYWEMITAYFRTPDIPSSHIRIIREGIQGEDKACVVIELPNDDVNELYYTVRYDHSIFHPSTVRIMPSFEQKEYRADKSENGHFTLDYDIPNDMKEWVIDFNGERLGGWKK